MASVTCTRSDLFPNGTVVKVFPRQAFHQAGNQAPSGSEVGNATMTSGSCTVEGLVAGSEYTLAAEVASEWRFLSVQAPASTALVAATGGPEPQMQGLLGWSFDPLFTSGTFKLTTAGTLYKSRIPLRESVKITNLLLALTTKGATLTAAQCFAALYSEGRSLLRKTTAAELIAALEGALGVLTVPLETPVVAGPGYVDLGVYCVGTTLPAFASASGNSAAAMNAGSSGKGLRFSSADTGLTTAPPATMSETQVALASGLWVGLT